MRSWKILVWTRFRGDPQRIVTHCLEPRHLGEALPPGVRWTIDADAARRMLTEGVPFSVHGQLHTPVGTLSWPWLLTDFTAGLRITTTTSNPWFRRFIHRRRFERAIGGRTRFVEELILTPRRGWGPAVAAGVRASFVHMHRHLAQGLDADVVAQSKSFRLDPAKADHAEALMDGIDLP